MYSEHEKRNSLQRANNEFLRRMLGGELTVGAASAMNADTPSLPSYPERPPCNGQQEENELSECHTSKEMPSLAMVYSPKQCWKGLMNPQAALELGTQFTDLVLPFEGYGRGKGGACR